MKFLIDRCAGSRIASWLRESGHDVAELVGPDPGDSEILDQAAREGRILITLDKHFSQLVYHHTRAHCGLIRLPDVPATRRIQLLARILEAHGEDLSQGAVIAVRGDRIRTSQPRGGP